MIFMIKLKFIIVDYVHKIYKIAKIVQKIKIYIVIYVILDLFYQATKQSAY